MSDWQQPHISLWADGSPAGGAALHHAVSAVRLTGLASGKDRALEHRFAEQADFIAVLGGSVTADEDRVIDLRYVRMRETSASSSRVDIAYLLHCVGSSKDQAVDRAGRFTADLRIGLASASGGHSFEPVADADELEAYLSAQRYSHWAELRRRLTSVTLSRKITVGVIHPLVPRAEIGTGLFRAMLMSDDDLCLSFRVRLSAAADDALAPVRRVRALCNDATLEDVSREQALQVLANHQYIEYTLQDPSVCQLRIRMGSSAPIPPALVNILGSYVTASPGLYAVSGFTVDGGGYHSAIAQTDEDARVLAQDHEHLACSDWIGADADGALSCARHFFSAREAACAMHLPWPDAAGCPGIPSVRVKAALTLPDLAREGTCLGRTSFGGRGYEVRFQQKDRRRHQYVVGQTGTGKSTLLLSMIKADIAAGGGVGVIDPHGDLVEEVLGAIPDERLDDVVLFDPADAEYPMGLNLFEWRVPSQKDFLVQECVHIFYKLFDPHGTGLIGPQFEHWMRNAALTLMASPEGGTLIEMARLLGDYASGRRGAGGEYAKAKRSWVTDITVQDFWRQLDATSDFHISEMLNYFVSKFGRFYGNEMVRNIVGQGTSGFDIREVMDSGKILLVNLSKGMLGDENSKLLGMILTAKVQMAAMSRADMPLANRRDFLLYVDEFQNFTTDSFAAMLSEARKYRVSLVLANQFVQQLSDHVRDAVFGNAGSFVCYRLGPQDAAVMAHQFSPHVDEEDLKRLPNHQSYVRLLLDGYPSDPFVLTNQLAERVPSESRAQAVRDNSRKRLTHPRDEVMLAVEERLTSPRVHPGCDDAD